MKLEVTIPRVIYANDIDIFKAYFPLISKDIKVTYVRTKKVYGKICPILVYVGKLTDPENKAFIKKIRRLDDYTR